MCFGRSSFCNSNLFGGSSFRNSNLCLEDIVLRFLKFSCNILSQMNLQSSVNRDEVHMCHLDQEVLSSLNMETNISFFKCRDLKC